LRRRWEPPKAKSPQQALGLAQRGPFTPAAKAATDTSVESAARVGIRRGGDAPLESIGDLASAMVGVLKRQTGKKRLQGAMFAFTVRKKVVDYLRAHREGATADEIAKVLEHSILTVRPRVSELHRMGLITDSGRRAENASGHRAIVWIVAQGELIS
jgi:hypothetical protein